MLNSYCAPALLGLGPGDPAPTFHQRSPANPKFNFDSAAGRYLVLCFFGSAANDHARKALKAVLERPDVFDDERASFFGVSIDPEDEVSARVANRAPGVRFFWDFDLSVSRLYGVAPKDDIGDWRQVPYRQQWVVTDPTTRILSVIPFRQDGGDIAEVMAHLRALPPPERISGVEVMAPILYLPRVFEPELCRHLIRLYDAEGGGESGFMREVDGRTVGINDPSFKRRKDINLEDQSLIRALHQRIARKVVPEIAKVHQFAVTRIERNIVSCYAAEEGGHFAPHRDNTTKGTAHRRFAVSINLNDDFEGGEVCFPEYGPRGFKAMQGGAVVFSCSLLHAVRKVTRGRRYAFLPFLYDEAAARIRQANARFIETKAGAPPAQVSPGRMAPG